MSLEGQPLASILSTDAWLMGRAPDQEPAEQVFPFKILLPIHSPIHVFIELLFCTRLRGIAENSGIVLPSQSSQSWAGDMDNPTGNFNTVGGRLWPRQAS